MVGVDGNLLRAEVILFALSPLPAFFHIDHGKKRVCLEAVEADEEAGEEGFALGIRLDLDDGGGVDFDPLGEVGEVDGW